VRYERWELTRLVRRLANPSLTILLTSTKWSDIFWPEFKQAVFAKKLNVAFCGNWHKIGKSSFWGKQQGRGEK
jgi:hypothetical protein